MSAIDVNSINPILKDIYGGKPSKTKKKERFSRIREALNRKALPNNGRKPNKK